MSNRNINDPYGGETGLVDRMIGTAYDVVKFVACRIDHVIKVSRHMDSVINISNEVRNNRVVRSVVPAQGATVEVPVPVDILNEAILGFDLMVKTAAGNMYPLGSATFVGVIKNRQLEFTTSAGAPTGFVGSEIIWTIFYKGDLND